jgi:hypothetical protein
MSYVCDICHSLKVIQNSLEPTSTLVADDSSRLCLPLECVQTNAWADNVGTGVRQHQSPYRRNRLDNHFGLHHHVHIKDRRWYLSCLMEQMLHLSIPNR